MSFTLNRRSILSAGALTTLGVVAAGPGVASQSKGGALRGQPANSKKAWAQTTLRGCEAFILASMTPDMAQIDEEGVRRDVRHAIAQGLLSALPSSAGLRPEQKRRMMEVVADEGKGKLLTIASLLTGNPDAQVEAIRHAEGIGCSHAIMLNDPKLKTQDEIYGRMREVIERTSMAVVLYASPDPAWKALDPTGIPLDAFDRLADLPNVVGIKLTQIIPHASALAVAERLGDRLLISSITLEQMMMLSLKYPMQWTGQWAMDTMQTPAKRYVVQFLELVAAKKLDEALALYWQFEPAARAFYELQAPTLAVGGHPWVHIKYMQWLTGGNGGLLPDLKVPATVVPPLDAAGREACRKALSGVGLALTDRSDESFAVGNAAYDRGVRIRDLAVTPQYAV